MHHTTPLLHSRPLSQRLGTQVHLKMDALQPTGSFKLRGIGHACRQYAAQGAQGFVSSSGGNAGIAVAYAARQLHLPARVVVPQTTSPHAIDQIRGLNAEVIVQGASWQEANAAAQALCTPVDRFIHPFDDPLLWQGHASLVQEVADSGLHPDAIVLSVGGGGLLSGIAAGLDNLGWHDTTLIAAETTGAASLHAARTAGYPMELDAIASIATSLGARQVCDQALAAAAKHPLINPVVSDAQAVQACLAFLDTHRVLIEPACGAALAVLEQEAATLSQFDNVLVVVCGGSTATLQMLQDWAASLVH